MNRPLQIVLRLLLTVALLVGVGQAQRVLNLDRDRLGLTRVAPLENAPPVLAFTTVALGGFRGLISNLLWIRANDLQDQDKFFEMVQLADWITKLEPHFPQVWVHEAWNMAYNISVKFKDFSDRWRWVQRGLELLRDEGLRYNPNETLIYRELGWYFQHKMGQNLDDANMYYKQQWANEMAEVFGKGKPNLDELVNPKTEDQKARARLLRDKFKMDPVFMKEVDERDGPLEWRLPEASAIYWGEMGLKKAQENPTKVNKDDLIMLRRLIYQSMQLSFYRGRLVANPFAKRFEFGPNLELVGKVNAAYERAIQEDVKNRDNIAHAHRNFLRDAVYFLYEYNRLADAARWYKYMAEKYPKQTLIENRPDSLPSKMTVDEYAMSRIQEDVGETSRDRVKAALEGLLFQSYQSLALGENDRAAGLKLMAQKIYDRYQIKTEPSGERIRLPPLAEIDREMLGRALDPERGLPAAARNVIRTELGLPAEVPSAPDTNAPPSTSGTNAPSQTSAGR